MGLMEGAFWKRILGNVLPKGASLSKKKVELSFICQNESASTEQAILIASTPANLTSAGCQARRERGQPQAARDEEGFS